MTEPLTYPPLTEHRQFARLPSHSGAASVTVGDTTYTGAAEFLLPVSGDAIAAFHTSERLDTQDFGKDLVIEGTFEGAPFRLLGPTCYVRHQIKHESAPGGWSLISPVNAPARIEYGDSHPVAAAVVMLNNFDYRCGDGIDTGNGGFTRIGTPFTTDLGTRGVTFRHRPDHDRVQPLLRAGVLSNASLTECRFDVAVGESDDDLLALTADIAGLCTIAAGAGVGVAMLTLRDGNGAPVRRIIPEPIESHYRRNDIIDDFHLPAFFRATFDEYVNMKRTHAAWQKLASYCGSLEDAPYLEEKFASLIMALEFFARNSLVEAGRPEDEVSGLDFMDAMGAARRHLGWEIPKHYMTKQTIRLWRNAVMHGGEWPDGGDSAGLRRLFDKWRLFLFRRALIRLGYQGKIISPHKGWTASSDVGDFSAEHNSFAPADPEDDPMGRFLKRLKEHNANDAAQS
ncbi:MAG: hypothetical protein IT564_05570 [Rhodospirillales bacterium]|nr:hypothetical protein [Rhodospirillales bacterium]